MLTRNNTRIKIRVNGWKSPQVFELTAKDGKSNIYGSIWKATYFDTNSKYPIIYHSYTGPYKSIFPTSFERAFAHQDLAELGFTVMVVDGQGPSGPSKVINNHSFKNMGNNLEDHGLDISHLGSLF